MLNPYLLTSSVLNDLEGYSFNCNAGNGYFIYHTDVSQTCGNPQHPVFEVSFTRPTLITKKVRDSRVRDTICGYLDSIMHNHDAVLTYAPFQGDNKHLARLVMFDGWTQDLRIHFKCSDILSKQLKYEVVVDGKTDIYNYVVLYRPHQSNTLVTVEQNLDTLFGPKV